MCPSTTPINTAVLFLGAGTYPTNKTAYHGSTRYGFPPDSVDFCILTIIIHYFYTGERSIYQIHYVMQLIVVLYIIVFKFLNGEHPFSNGNHKTTFQQNFLDILEIIQTWLQFFVGLNMPTTVVRTILFYLIKLNFKRLIRVFYAENC